jgi:hypothetical protein
MRGLFASIERLRRQTVPVAKIFAGSLRSMCPRAPATKLLFRREYEWPLINSMDKLPNQRLITEDLRFVRDKKQLQNRS